MAVANYKTQGHGSANERAVTPNLPAGRIILCGGVSSIYRFRRVASAGGAAEKVPQPVDATSGFLGSPDMADYPPWLVYDPNDLSH
jgi:hypothetical protein